MRTISFLLLLTCALSAAAEQADKTRPPKKGDTVIIKGCLRGSAVEGASTTLTDEAGNQREGPAIPTLTYRLEGDKKQLKALKDDHDRRVVEVTGVLKSELSGNGLGTTVGKTRINIGVDPGANRGAHQAVPVLRVLSFEGTTVSCDK